LGISIPGFIANSKEHTSGSSPFVKKYLKWPRESITI